MTIYKDCVLFIMQYTTQSPLWLYFGWQVGVGCCSQDFISHTILVTYETLIEEDDAIYLLCASIGFDVCSAILSRALEGYFDISWIDILIGRLLDGCMTSDCIISLLST